MSCYYEILHLRRDCSPEDIKRAYKREALACHPDKVGGSPEANDRFVKVSEAYQILRNAEKRVIYDKYGKDGFKAIVHFENSATDSGSSSKNKTDSSKNSNKDGSSSRKRHHKNTFRFRDPFQVFEEFFQLDDQKSSSVDKNNKNGEMHPLEKLFGSMDLSSSSSSERGMKGMTVETTSFTTKHSNGCSTTYTREKRIVNKGKEGKEGVLTMSTVTMRDQKGREVEKVIKGEGEWDAGLDKYMRGVQHSSSSSREKRGHGHEHGNGYRSRRASDPERPKRSETVSRKDERPMIPRHHTSYHPNASKSTSNDFIERERRQYSHQFSKNGSLKKALRDVVSPSMSGTGVTVGKMAALTVSPRSKIDHDTKETFVVKYTTDSAQDSKISRDVKVVSNDKSTNLIKYAPKDSHVNEERRIVRRSRSDEQLVGNSTPKALDPNVVDQDHARRKTTSMIVKDNNEGVHHHHHFHIINNPQHIQFVHSRNMPLPPPRPTFGHRPLMLAPNIPIPQILYGAPRAIMPPPPRSHTINAISTSDGPLPKLPPKIEDRLPQNPIIDRSSYALRQDLARRHRQRDVRYSIPSQGIRHSFEQRRH